MSNLLMNISISAVILNLYKFILLALKESIVSNKCNLGRVSLSSISNCFQTF